MIAGDGARVLVWQAGPPRVWSAAGTIELAVAGGYRPVGFALGGRAIVLEEGHAVRIYDAATGALDTTIADAAMPSLDPAGRFLTTILADHSVQIRDLEDGSIRAFAGEQLQQAQTDARGELIAAIDKLGAAVLVMNAGDGRVLARWPIAHAPPSVRQDGFDAPHATAAWARDGETLISMSLRLARWTTSTAIGGDTAQLVRRNVPWLVSDGKLVPARARLHGTVVRGDVPVAGARLRLVFRKPADLGAGSITWAAAAFEKRPLPPLTTGPAGELALGDLAPGRYSVEITADGQTRATEVDVDVEDEQVVLDLDRLPAP